MSQAIRNGTPGLQERLHDPEVEAALCRLLDRAAEIDRLLELTDRIPGMLATITDIVDEEYRKAADAGLDLERSIAHGVRAALRFGQRVDPGQIDRLIELLNSDVLHPAAVRVVGAAGQAMAGAAARPRRAGVFGLLRALWDADVQRALGFFVEFARCFGVNLHHKDTKDTKATQRKSESRGAIR